MFDDGSGSGKEQRSGSKNSLSGNEYVPDGSNMTPVNRTVSKSTNVLPPPPKGITVPPAPKDPKVVNVLAPPTTEMMVEEHRNRPGFKYADYVEMKQYKKKSSPKSNSKSSGVRSDSNNVSMPKP